MSNPRPDDFISKVKDTVDHTSYAPSVTVADKFTEAKGRPRNPDPVRIIGTSMSLPGSTSEWSDDAELRASDPIEPVPGPSTPTEHTQEEPITPKTPNPIEEARTPAQVDSEKQEILRESRPMFSKRSRWNRSARSRSNSRNRGAAKQAYRDPAHDNDPRVKIDPHLLNTTYDIGTTPDGWYGLTKSVRDFLDEFITLDPTNPNGPVVDHARATALSNLWMADRWAHLSEAESEEDIRYFIYLLPDFWPHDYKRRAHGQAAANLEYLLTYGAIRSGEWLGEESMLQLQRLNLNPFPTEVVGMGGRPMELQQSPDPVIQSLINTIGTTTKRSDDKIHCVESKLQELTVSVQKLSSAVSDLVKATKGSHGHQGPGLSAASDSGKSKVSQTVGEIVRPPVSRTPSFGGTRVKTASARPANVFKL
jgi:hypothetical protein